MKRWIAMALIVSWTIGGVGSDKIKSQVKNQSLVISGTPITSKADDRGNITFYAIEDGHLRAVSTSYVSAVAASALVKAKGVACGLAVKPDTIEVSAGMVALTWNTDRLCGK